MCLARVMPTASTLTSRPRKLHANSRHPVSIKGTKTVPYRSIGRVTIENRLQTSCMQGYKLVIERTQKPYDSLEMVCIRARHASLELQSMVERHFRHLQKQTMQRMLWNNSEVVTNSRDEVLQGDCCSAALHPSPFLQQEGERNKSTQFEPCEKGVSNTGDRMAYQGKLGGLACNTAARGSFQPAPVFRSRCRR